MDSPKMSVVLVCCLVFVTGISGLVFPNLPSGIWDSTNAQCAKDSRHLQEGLGNLTLWAYSMWESSAHSSTGVLRGSTHQLGQFEECVYASAPFRTQYCLVEMNVHVPPPKEPRDMYDTNYNPNGPVLDKLYHTGDKSRVPRNVLVMGLCTPASCSNADIQQELNEHISLEDMNKNSLNLTYDVKVMAETCQTDRAEEGFDAADWAFCILILLLVVAVIICTLWDFRQIDQGKVKNLKSLPARIFMCFSARKNFSELNNRDDSNDALSILYGMRTIAIFMIIMDHRFGTYITGPLLNREYVEQQYRTVASMFFFHGDLFVDSFFVLSGLLVTYSLLVSFEKKITPPGLIILNRYIRLTPIFAVVVFFYATVLYKTGSGPMWKLIVGEMQADCRNNWWAALLYIGNYVNDEHMCMVHSWFLPCDFHYFILAIPTVILLRKKPMTAIGLMFVVLIIGILIPFGITLYFKRPALLHFYLDFLTAAKKHPDFRMTYTKSHTRISPYIIGMFTGYAYYKLRNSSIKLSLLKSNVLTVMGLVLMFGGMASGGVFYDPYHPYNAIEAALYAGLHRQSWALGSAVLLLNASYGHFGIMREILKWEPWIPLSKLVYGAYLMHMCFQLRSTAMIMSPRYAAFFDIFYLALGDIVLSFVLALFLYLLVEAPCRKIFRVLMTPPPRNLPVNGDAKPEVNVQERTVITIVNGNEDSQL